MNRQELSHWDYEDDDQYDYQDQYHYDQDQYDCPDHHYHSNSYRNNGGRYQSSYNSSNGTGRKSNAGRRNDQQSVSLLGQQSQALNDEPTVGHIGFLEVVPSSSSAIPSKSTISKMAPSGGNIVVNVININHKY
ncbi:uncharacterized protein LOC110179235 [Drosophila serrata]|uniref:uncharacterized protein LOC110179235 n=1 Tax=Drosophila serrata TaxID=7274 RepID=UPI000A1D0FC2|nr:uncharacterized protein LOC110179235 [Drosophila serrata]